MHTTHSNTQYKNESKHSEVGPVRQNPIQRTVSLFICVCIALCTIVAHNIAQNRPDSFPPYPPNLEMSGREFCKGRRKGTKSGKSHGKVRELVLRRTGSYLKTLEIGKTSRFIKQELITDWHFKNLTCDLVIVLGENLLSSPVACNSLSQSRAVCSRSTRLYLPRPHPTHHIATHQ